MASDQPSLGDIVDNFRHSLTLTLPEMARVLDASQHELRTQHRGRYSPRVIAALHALAEALASGEPPQPLIDVLQGQRTRMRSSERWQPPPLTSEPILEAARQTLILLRDTVAPDLPTVARTVRETAITSGYDISSTTPTALTRAELDAAVQITYRLRTACEEADLDREHIEQISSAFPDRHQHDHRRRLTALGVGKGLFRKDLYDSYTDLATMKTLYAITGPTPADLYNFLQSAAWVEAALDRHFIAHATPKVAQLAQEEILKFEVRPGHARYSIPIPLAASLRVRLKKARAYAGLTVDQASIALWHAVRSPQPETPHEDTDEKTEHAAAREHLLRLESGTWFHLLPFLVNAQTLLEDVYHLEDPALIKAIETDLAAFEKSYRERYLASLISKREQRGEAIELNKPGLNIGLLVHLCRKYRDFGQDELARLIGCGRHELVAVEEGRLDTWEQIDIARSAFALTAGIGTNTAFAAKHKSLTGEAADSLKHLHNRPSAVAASAPSGRKQHKGRKPSDSGQPQWQELLRAARHYLARQPTIADWPEEQRAALEAAVSALTKAHEARIAAVNPAARTASWASSPDRHLAILLNRTLEMRSRTAAQTAAELHLTDDAISRIELGFGCRSLPDLWAAEAAFALCGTHPWQTEAAEILWTIEQRLRTGQDPQAIELRYQHWLTGRAGDAPERRIAIATQHSALRRKAGVSLADAAAAVGGNAADLMHWELARPPISLRTVAMLMNSFASLNASPDTIVRVQAWLEPELEPLGEEQQAWQLTSDLLRVHLRNTQTTASALAESVTIPDSVVTNILDGHAGSHPGAVEAIIANLVENCPANAQRRFRRFNALPALLPAHWSAATRLLVLHELTHWSSTRELANAAGLRPSDLLKLTNTGIDQNPTLASGLVRWLVEPNEPLTVTPWVNPEKIVAPAPRIAGKSSETIATEPVVRPDSENGTVVLSAEIISAPAARLREPRPGEEELARLLLRLSEVNPEVNIPPELHEWDIRNLTRADCHQLLTNLGLPTLSEEGLEAHTLLDLVYDQIGVETSSDQGPLPLAPSPALALPTWSDIGATIRDHIARNSHKNHRMEELDLAFSALASGHGYQYPGVVAELASGASTRMQKELVPLLPVALALAELRTWAQGITDGGSQFDKPGRWVTRGLERTRAIGQIPLHLLTDNVITALGPSLSEKYRGLPNDVDKIRKIAATQREAFASGRYGQLDVIFAPRELGAIPPKLALEQIDALKHALDVNGNRLRIAVVPQAEYNFPCYLEYSNSADSPMFVDARARNCRWPCLENTDPSAYIERMTNLARTTTPSRLALNRIRGHFLRRQRENREQNPLHTTAALSPTSQGPSRQSKTGKGPG
ncbi:MAG: hypothetical protein HOQ05_10250 [Corynebacteriales bacterium]|nr:hypothetical protein [Mycobacteriales bacterium]